MNESAAAAALIAALDLAPHPEGGYQRAARCSIHTASPAVGWW